MKKVIAILVVLVGFAFNTNAQDSIKKETVKTVLHPKSDKYCTLGLYCEA